jgi:hypothetical protein
VLIAKLSLKVSDMSFGELPLSRVRNLFHLSDQAKLSKKQARACCSQEVSTTELIALVVIADLSLRAPASS